MYCGPSGLPDLKVRTTTAISSRRLAVPERELAGHLGQPRMILVAGGEQRLADRPGDRQPRIVPGDPDLARRVVKIGAFVLDLGDRADDAEAVGEPGRYVALPEVFRRERDRDPPPEHRGAAPDVHGNVVHLALDDANQLALRPADLQVQPAER